MRMKLLSLAYIPPSSDFVILIRYDDDEHNNLDNLDDDNYDDDTNAINISR